jgi:DNA-directed RNA polymerase specialized sigma24 family protein
MNQGPTKGLAMSHDEIAKRLGITRRTVIRIEQRALRKLRLSLECIGDELARTERHEHALDELKA